MKITKYGAQQKDEVVQSFTYPVFFQVRHDLLYSLLDFSHESCHSVRIVLFQVGLNAGHGNKRNGGGGDFRSHHLHVGIFSTLVSFWTIKTKKIHKVKYMAGNGADSYSRFNVVLDVG